jgi:hypothetical protein
MVGCGQMRCWARLRWSLVMLCLTAVGVKVQAAADEGQQPGEQLLDRAADGGDLVRGNGRWAITWRRMTRRLRTNEPVEPVEPARGRPLELHETPDLGAVDPDVGFDVGGRLPDGGEIHAEEFGAALKRGGDWPGEGGVVSLHAR